MFTFLKRKKREASQLITLGVEINGADSVTRFSYLSELLHEHPEIIKVRHQAYRNLVIYHVVVTQTEYDHIIRKLSENDYVIGNETFVEFGFTHVIFLPVINK